LTSYIISLIGYLYVQKASPVSIYSVQCWLFRENSYVINDQINDGGILISNVDNDNNKIKKKTQPFVQASSDTIFRKKYLHFGSLLVIFWHICLRDRTIDGNRLLCGTVCIEKHEWGSTQADLFSHSWQIMQNASYSVKIINRYWISCYSEIKLEWQSIHIYQKELTSPNSLICVQIMRVGLGVVMHCASNLAQQRNRNCLDQKLLKSVQCIYYVYIKKHTVEMKYLTNTIDLLVTPAYLINAVDKLTTVAFSRTTNHQCAGGSAFQEFARSCQRIPTILFYKHWPQSRIYVEIH
jgi:hypothetical protein